MYATPDLEHLICGITADSSPGIGAVHGRTNTLPIPCQRQLLDVTEVLEHRPQAAAAARHTAQQVLRSWQISDWIADEVLLVVSELVTNAVEHAQPPLALHLHLEHAESRILVEVSDGGPATHDGAWTASCAEDEHGRGLGIVDLVSEAHGSHADPCGGTTHWAQLTMTAAC
ncbi:ATP-binding protein [Streptomyces sp. NPDC002285]